MGPQLRFAPLPAVLTLCVSTSRWTRHLAALLKSLRLYQWSLSNDQINHFKLQSPAVMMDKVMSYEVLYKGQIRDQKTSKKWYEYRSKWFKTTENVELTSNLSATFQQNNFASSRNLPETKSSIMAHISFKGKYFRFFAFRFAKDFVLFLLSV